MGDAKSEAFDFDVPDGPYDEISIDLEATVAMAEVTPDATAAKTASIQQADSMATVAFRIGGLSEQGTVCASGELFGPYMVTLDAQGKPTGVDQSPIPLSDTEVALLNSGQFSMCIEIESPVDGTVTIEAIMVDLRKPPSIDTEDSSCNPACGFQDGGPEGRAAAAICSIVFFPFAGAETASPVNSASCGNDAQCDDGNDCTIGFCQGGGSSPGGDFGFCSVLAVPGCFTDEELPMVANGDMVSIEFDHSLVSATVNGTSTQDEGSLWIANGLSSGRQTLLIEWQNRSGSNPATGCHRVDVFVQGDGTGVDMDDFDNFCDFTECPAGTVCNPTTFSCDEFDNSCLTLGCPSGLVCNPDSLTCEAPE